MGKEKNKQVVALIILLLLTSAFVYRPVEMAPEKGKSTTLKDAFLTVGNGYGDANQIPLPETIVETLELDDYVQNQYVKEANRVDLYIGYYYSIDKVSSAHDPLVCFPGQGWQINNQAGNKLMVGENRINYSEMVASIGEQKILVMYWFQAHDKTTRKIYKNKLNTLANKLKGKKQDHAFVRISVPFNDRNIEDVRASGVDFIKSFYPLFLGYIN